MENVLKAITRQANLERILFTPAMKKLYFDMAVGSGGLTQFKHTDSTTGGLKFVADKADDNKHTLLFCGAHELIQGYDQLFDIAQRMLPVIVLAVREETPEEWDQNWSYMQLGEIGWLVFFTHTTQEIYDHLVLAYSLFELHKIKIPVMILQSTTTPSYPGSFQPKENINLGHTLAGLQTSRVGRDKFDDLASAFKAAQEKNIKQTLRAMFDKVVENIREEYDKLNYAIPEEGLPFKTHCKEGNRAIVSILPPSDGVEIKDCTFLRPYCFRPSVQRGMHPLLADKERIAMVEPLPSPGIVTPTFFAEMSHLNRSDLADKMMPFVVPPPSGILSQQQVDDIMKIMDDSIENPGLVTQIHKI